MKKVFNQFVVAMFGLIFTAAVQAGAQPKFSIEVAEGGRAPAELPLNATATAIYKITNNTRIKRLLTMVPITGISQINTNMEGACNNPFELYPGYSCFLHLRLTSNQLGTGVHSGPVICKTRGNENSPDPFLCSEAAGSNKLNVTVIAPLQPTLSVSPIRAIITTDGLTQTIITVTNHPLSSFYATNVRAILPAAWTTVQQDNSDCNPSPGIGLAPGASCTLVFTSTFPFLPFTPRGGIVVRGDNTATPSPTIALAFRSDGGLVYLVDGNGNIEVVPEADNSAGMQWGNKVTTGALSNTNGNANTTLIIATPGIGINAAQTCADYVAGGFNDWYLPARDQLNTIYQNLHLLGFGSFASSIYWSSTEFNQDRAWYQSFATGAQGNILEKDQLFRVRCARTSGVV